MSKLMFDSTRVIIYVIIRLSSGHRSASSSPGTSLKVCYGL